MCCGSKKSVDATVPPRPVRRPHPSGSQSYAEPEIYPERSWHTQSQEDWTGVYGPDFDMMKKELTSAGKWEQMKNEGKWEYMAGEMAWTMVKLGNKELIDKWTKLEKQAKKNREREQTRLDEHRRRAGRDREYLRDYYAQARRDLSAKKTKLEKEAAKKKAAEEAKKLEEAKKAEAAKVLAVAKQLDRARQVRFEETVARIPYQTDNQKAKKKAAEALKKLEKVKKLEEAKKAALAKKGRLQRRTV
jgi:hypothetical protein